VVAARDRSGGQIILEDILVRKTAKRKAASRKRTARRTVRKAAPRRSTKRPTRKAKSSARRGSTKMWRADEVSTLRKKFKTTPTREIARQLRRSLSSVRSKAVALSLKKGVARKAASKRKIAYRRSAKRGRCC